MKRMLPLLLVLCLLLCACSQNQPEQTTAPKITTAPSVETTAATEATEQTTVPETTAPTVPEETTAPTEVTEPTEPEVLFRNPLDGTPMDGLCTTRPYAVTINNQIGALPVCTLSQAKIAVEILAEGGITRFVGIYNDISELDHIGSIRSTRPYIVDIAESFDAIYVHHGGSRDGYGRVYDLGTANVDAERNAGGYFYRDQTRLDYGYDLEHTSFADGGDLVQAATDLGYDLSNEEGYDYGFQFANIGSAAAGEIAETMTVVFGDYGKTTGFDYDADTNTYAISEYGDALVDGNNDEPLCYRNVISIGAPTGEYVDADNILRMEISLTGEGSGYFACDGKVVPICWYRADVYDPFTFTHEDGTPITLGIGKTYIGITPTNGYLEY